MYYAPHRLILLKKCIRVLKMAGHTKIGLIDFSRHNSGKMRYFARTLGQSLLGWTAGLIIVAASLTAGSAQAGEEFVDFEEFSGPNKLASAAPPLTVGSVTLSGGQLVTDVPALRKVNRSTVYGTANFCGGCQKTITIEFSEPVSNVSFRLMNGSLIQPWFEVYDDLGNSVSFKLGSYYNVNSNRLVTLPSSGIRRVVVGQANIVTKFWWEFYIDNLRYTVEEDQQYLVNFSAFVPHDNMPAAPTAFCLSKDSWQLPGLARLGKSPGGNARWARDEAFAPGKPGNGRPPFKFNDVSSETGDDELHGNRRKLYFAGDNRDFHPAAPSYRVRQLVTAITDETLDADGLKDDSVQNLAGEVRAFAGDALADGVIDETDEDGIADDCRLFHKAHLAETDLMNVAVARTGPQTVDIRFSGSLDSPLAGPAQVLGAIDWEFTLTLDNSVKPGRWTLSGAHDGFPAYEIYINGMPIYRHDPGPPPYGFASDVRKLLPPLDIEVVKTSGDLP